MRVGGERVVVFDASSTLIYAGWLPQDGLFRLEWIASLEVERDPNAQLRIAHRRLAGHSQTLGHIPHRRRPFIPDIYPDADRYFGVDASFIPRVWPTTSTSRPVLVRSRHWRPPHVYRVRRNAPTVRAAAGSLDVLELWLWEPRPSSVPPVHAPADTAFDDARQLRPAVGAREHCRFC